MSHQVALVDDGLVVDGGRSLHSLSFSFLQSADVPEEFASFITKTSKVSILFDPVSLQPLVMTYALHPDGDDVRGIPVRVEFSQFKELDGLSVPYRIDRYLNGTLQLSLQASTVTLQ